MRMNDYPYAVPQDLLLTIAQEKVLEDVEQFGVFLSMAPTDREPCSYFGSISTFDLIAEILLKTKATDKQLAEGVKELRKRFLADRNADVAAVFQRLQAEEFDPVSAARSSGGEW